MGIFKIWGKTEEETLASRSLENDTSGLEVAGKRWRIRKQRFRVRAPETCHLGLALKGVCDVGRDCQPGASGQIDHRWSYKDLEKKHNYFYAPK